MIQNIHAHRGLAKISSCLSQNWGEVGKKVLLYSIFIFTNQISIASEAAGEVAATTTVDYLGTAFGIGSCANASVKLYSAGKDIKSYTFPNEKEQVENNKISKKLVLAMAESDFKHCLVTNKLSVKRGYSGLPTSCEEAALMLIRCGGENEVIDMTAIFNARKGQN